MSQKESLGIRGWDTLEFIVNDIERSEQFYLNSMGLPATARASEKHIHQTGEDTLLFSKGAISLACITPKEKGSRAARWLKRHPDGIAVLALRVRDLQHTHDVLQKRNATFITKIKETTDHIGQPFKYFEIATPLGDVRMRFVEREHQSILPGLEPIEQVKNIESPFQFIDHVTSNMLTLEPYISWLKEVLGFEQYWDIQFHTGDSKGEEGSGLASIVMWDPESKVKLANNEPAWPNFEASQIYTFVEENNGPGVQHLAFHVRDIQHTVGTLNRQGIEFLNVPNTYYDMLPTRLNSNQVTNFEENIEQLKSLGILVDGADDKYLLQIFMKEAALLYSEEQAGPFFYEVIQRKGSNSFGEGNFRALFEAIERDQTARSQT